MIVMIQKPSPPRRTGRPLSFDRNQVLERAMLTFWRCGYETTSISMLTAAMGVTAPSIYATFGDKKGLFLEAMRRYAGPPLLIERSLNSASTACEAVHAMLLSAAEGFTGESTPRGCLLASATASGSDESADVRREVARVRRGIVKVVRARIRKDVRSGAMPASTNAAALASLVIAVIQGMSVLARDGTSRSQLKAVANEAMRAWPGPI